MQFHLCKSLPGAILAFVFVEIFSLNANANAKDSIQTKSSEQSVGRFKLQATFESFPTDLVVTEGFKFPKRIEGAFMQQVGQIRKDCPSWSGFHVLSPGSSAKGN